MKILVIETDTNRLRTLRSILSSLGYRAGDVESETDPEAGSSAFKRRRYDVVFVAKWFPKNDSSEILAEVKEAAAATETPIVVFGSDTQKEDVLAAIEGGAASYLAMPCSVGDVEETLAKLTKRKS